MSDEEEKQKETQEPQPPSQPPTPALETERKIAQKFVSATTQSFIPVSYTHLTLPTNACV